MSVYLFAVPLVPGKTEKWENYMRELTGAKSEGYKKSRKQVGISVEQAFLQKTPQGDFVVVRWEADDPKKAFEHLAKSNEPFDEWFREKILTECHNMDLSRTRALNTIILDHREKREPELAHSKKS